MFGFCEIKATKLHKTIEIGWLKIDLIINILRCFVGEIVYFP